jgi:rare lipoprotein A
MKRIARAVALLGLCLAPSLAEAATRTVTASWYGARWTGRPTASGERYDHRMMTAASRTLPLGTVILVSHGDRRVIVRINDRGPHVAGRGLDLSEAAARGLGMLDQGVARVTYRVLRRT